MNTETQLWAIEKRLENIETLLQNLQPKPKKIRQSKIVDVRPLEEQIKPLLGKYSPLLVEKFLNYWNECQRWRKEKVFDVEKRLERFKMNGQQWDYERSQKQQLKKVDEKPIHREFKEVREDTSFNSIKDLLKY